MKFFTKLLPFKDQIKHGDIILNTCFGSVKFIEDIKDGFYDCIILSNNRRVTMNADHNYKTGRMFLCSKDIPKNQRDNTVYHNELGWGKLYSFALSNHLHISFDSQIENYEISGWNHTNVDFTKDQTVFVIGEISSLAMWVKEGEEFYFEDLNPLTVAAIEHNQPITDIIKIKNQKDNRYY